MKLLFVRHGDPDYEHDCLTKRGRKEAQAVAKRLAPVEIDAFFVSPLGRAQETARPTLEVKGMTAKTCKWLREFDAPIHRPDADGRLKITWDWLPQDWVPVREFYSIDTWLSEPHMRETDVAAQYNWVCGELDKVLAEYGYERDGKLYRVRQESEKTICFVCHYGVACVMLSHLLSISPMLLWHGLVAQPASISSLATEERRQGIATFRMNHYGDTSHIEAAGLPENYRACFAEVYSNMEQRHD